MSDWFDALRHDVHYALRQVARAPGLAAAVIATFGLGIGANATMFGVIDRLLLRPPAYVADPGHLDRLEVRQKDGAEEYTNDSYSYPTYLDFRDHIPGFSSVAMYTSITASLGLGADARKVAGTLVSGNYFATLGTHALVGRTILPSDDVPPNGTPVVVIGYGTWQREFSGSRAALGKSIMLAGRQFTIVGVAPKGFVGIGSRTIDIWIPVAAGDGLRFAGKNWATDRNSTWLTVIGRVRPGVSEQTLAQQVAAAYTGGQVAGGRKADSPARGQVTSVLPAHQREISAERRVATLLGGVSVLVLLIACANVANLLLARAFGRRREIAVRLALGISRSRLVRQLVTESVILALVGGVAALLVVQWGSTVVQRVLLRDYPWPDSAIDGHVLAFTTAATVIVGLIAGLIPALQGSDPHLSRTLREGSRGSGLSRSRTRASLLIVQAAVSVILLVGTGLFVRTLRNVHTLHLGIDANRLVNGTIDLRSVGIDSAAGDAYFDQAREAASRLPGVASVTLADGAPFGDWSISSTISVPGRDSLPAHKQSPLLSFVAPNYFSTVGTRLVRGRAFADADARPGSAPVIVINEAIARWLWPNASALGECIRMGEATDPCAEVVGIVETTHRSITEDEAPLQIYRPLRPGVSDPRTRVLVVRPTGNKPEALVEPIRRVMQTVSTGVPYANVRPMWSGLDSAMRPWQLGATMFSAFGLIALVLSSLGLYSVVAYTVAQRMHEMGVRVALGAQASDIRRLVLAQGLRVAMIGVSLGIIGALFGGKFIAPLLFKTSPRDPVVFGVVVVLLLAVATVASLVPSRRAMRADPLGALRSE